MKRISNCIKIFFAVILVVALSKVGSVKGVEEKTEVVSPYERLEISADKNASVKITKAMFDLTETDWFYIHYNSSGEVVDLDVINSSFNGFTLNKGEYALVSTTNVEATMNYTSIAESCSVERRDSKLVDYLPIDYTYYFDIHNNGDTAIDILVKGNFKVDLTYLDANGGTIREVADTTLPTTLESGERIYFTASSKGNYDIKEAKLGTVYYTMAEHTDVDAYYNMLDKYSAMTTWEWATDGTIYTIVNNANYDIEVKNLSKCVIQYDRIDADGTVVETYSNYGCAPFDDCYFHVTIPAGGKVIYYYYDEPDASQVLTTTFYTVQKDALTCGEIYVPEGDITKSGTYRLDSEKEYTLGSGKWTVEGDKTVYSGGVSFYVEESGDYELTLQ